MELNEDSGEEIRPSTNLIGDLADAYFPIRDKDGKPSYREHQRETIIQAAKAFYIDGKKFVAIDGPVGCGKSAINYTIARIAEDTVYLTPLKMLQDQIVAEEWDGVKMLKGRGSYACNFCSYETIDYKCDYAGEDFETCNNSKEKDTFDSNTIDKLGEKIKNVHESFSHNKFILRLRSAFSDYKEYANSIEKMKNFSLMLKEKFFERVGIPVDKVKYDFDLEKNICCTMGEVHECPAKSSGFLAKMAPVKVLNPDIFFLLNKSPFSFYQENSLMVYDECQQIEGVMARIFKVKIPLETIKLMFGVDMLHLYDITDVKELINEMSKYIKDKLAPLLAASKTIGALGDVCGVRNVDTLERMRSVTSMAKKLKDTTHNFMFYKNRANKNWSFSILEIINCAFTGKPAPQGFDVFAEFIQSVRDTYRGNCESLRCEGDVDLYETLIPASRRFIDNNTLNRKRNSRTRQLKGGELANYELKHVLVSEDLIYADHMYLFGKTVSQFVTSAIALLNSENTETPSFIISPVRMESIIACKRTPIYKDVAMGVNAYRKEKCLEITPIAVGRLMNNFFYSKAKKVLLSSGTWICPESLFKIYGIPLNDVEFIKIPSSFNPENRKIYVIDNNNFTNFSEKTQGGYAYKTESGINKFTLELSSIVNRVRRYINDNHNKNTNIVVHCHTFDIARKVAEYAPGVDNSYLIHLQQPGSHIKNIPTGNDVWTKDKDDIIQLMKDRPNSGLTLISPSVSEGVDFKGDSARAQIILKRPIPYLGDVYVQSYYKGNPDVGIEIDPDFLDRVCYTILSQQYGRVMRSRDDWGYTIIMDQSITWALKGLMKRRRRVDDLNIKYLWDGLQVGSSRTGMPSFTWVFG